MEYIMTKVEELRAELAALKASNGKSTPKATNDGSVVIKANRARSIKRGKVCVEITFPGVTSAAEMTQAQVECKDALKAARCSGTCDRGLFAFSGKSKSWYGLEENLPKGYAINA